MGGPGSTNPLSGAIVSSPKLANGQHQQWSFNLKWKKTGHIGYDKQLTRVTATLRAPDGEAVETFHHANQNKNFQITFVQEAESGDATYRKVKLRCDGLHNRNLYFGNPPAADEHQFLRFCCRFGVPNAGNWLSRDHLTKPYENATVNDANIVQDNNAGGDTVSRGIGDDNDDDAETKKKGDKGGIS